MARRTTGNIIKIPGGSIRLIKPLIGYRDDILRQLEKFPYEKNVFLMMRFRKGNKKISDFIIRTLAKEGYTGVRADQPKWNITKDVYNPIAVLYCCKYGIALFDKPETNQAYNPNVIYELGFMHNLGRECLILRNDSLPAIPFDLIKNLYMPYRGTIAVEENIKQWLAGIVHTSQKTSAPATAPRKRKPEAEAGPALQNEQNIIEASPRNISGSEFKLDIKSKDKTSWKVTWSIDLLNMNRRTTKARVHVLFLTRDNFILDDHIGPVHTLPSNDSHSYSATTTMSPDLAKRIHHAMAKIQAAGK